MKISEYYEYKGVKYPIFDIYIWKYKSWYKVGTDSLAEAISPEGDFEDCDGRGEWIDQQLFFYIPDEMIGDSKRTIMNYINTQI